MRLPCAHERTEHRGFLARDSSGPEIRRWLNLHRPDTNVYDGRITPALFGHMKSCMRPRLWVNDEFEEEYIRYMHQRCVDEYGLNMVERFFHILIGFHIVSG